MFVFFYFFYLLLLFKKSFRHYMFYLLSNEDTVNFVHFHKHREDLSKRCIYSFVLLLYSIYCRLVISFKNVSLKQKHKVP